MNKFILFYICVLISITSYYGQLTIQNTSCNTAVDQIVGGGVNVSNISCNCNANAMGTFSGGSNLPVSEGIVLSTGGIDSITNGSCIESTSYNYTNNYTSGTLTGNIEDQCTIEFDIIPSCDTLKFVYFFASEEYNNQHYSLDNQDVFAFFISGPGFTGLQNIATIPNTTDPISVGTINSSTNSNLYISNSGGGTFCGNGIEFNGYTTQLTASAVVSKCSTYHIVITIGDRRDGLIDSGVFLASNSLTCPVNTMGVSVNKTDNICNYDCNGDISLSISNGVPPYSIQWDYQNSTASTLSNLCDGNYIVEVSDQACNIYRDTIEIISSQSLDAQINIDTVCNNIPTTFTDLSSVNFGNISSFYWDFGDGNNITNTNSSPYTHIYQNDGTYSAHLIITSNFGCKDTVYQDVIVHPVPNTNFTVQDKCLGATSFFLNQSTINSPGSITSYSWDFDDGFVSSSETPNNTYSNSGAYNVKLVLESNHGCLDSLVVTTNINPNPVANFGVEDDCVNIQAQFSDSSTISSGNISSWQWNFGDNSVVNNSQNPTHTYVLDTTYQVTLVVESDNGCLDSITKNTVRYAIPVTNFSVSPVCQYDSITIINNTTINSPSIMSNWIWNFGDGSPLSAVEYPKHKYSTSGSYSISLIATSNFGCVGDTTIDVQIFDVPIANFNNTVACENIPTEFTDLSTVNNDYISGWEWNFGDNNTDNSQNSTNLYTTIGTYTVNLIVSSSNSCLDTATNTVGIYLNPEAYFMVDTTEGCSPLCINFADTSLSNSNRIVEWQWDLGNGETSLDSTVTICYENSNLDEIDYTISLIVKNDLGCYDTIEKTDLITSWKNPIANFEINPQEINMYESNMISTSNNSEGATEYFWDFSNGQTSIDYEPTTIYPDTGTYNIMLAVNDDKGCVDTTYRSIKITPVSSIYIPNSFTPNDLEGDNTGFIYYGFGIDYSTTQFYIFDRWGLLIYYTENSTPWDGTYKGKKAMQDSYIYRLVCKDILGKKHEYVGHVTLIR